MVVVVAVVVVVVVVVDGVGRILSVVHPYCHTHY